MEYLLTRRPDEGFELRLAPDTSAYELLDALKRGAICVRITAVQGEPRENWSGVAVLYTGGALRGGVLGRPLLGAGGTLISVEKAHLMRLFYGDCGSLKSDMEGEKVTREKQSVDKLRSVSTNIIFVYAAIAIAVVFGAVFAHFFKGIDIPYISIVHEDTAAYWGQIGDFFGGMLNPILSFLALVAVLKTMELQRQEMKATQEETRVAIEEQKVQTQVYSRQMFDSTFFGMLDAYTKLTENIRSPDVPGAHGKEAFVAYVRKFKVSAAYQAGALSAEPVSWGTVSDCVFLQCEKHKSYLSHYFRNIYWILKIVDERCPTKFSDDDIRSYMEKRSYANMLRAQLSEAELAMIQINCFGPYGSGLKYYVEKYSILKPLGDQFFGPFAAAMCADIDSYAFASSENIEMDGIMRISKPLPD